MSRKMWTESVKECKLLRASRETRLEALLYVFKKELKYLSSWFMFIHSITSCSFELSVFALAHWIAQTASSLNNAQPPIKHRVAADLHRQESAAESSM